jgi:hypothetical protein
LKPRLEIHEVRLRGLWPQVLRAAAGHVRESIKVGN